VDCRVGLKARRKGKVSPVRDFSFRKPEGLPYIFWIVNGRPTLLARWVLIL
jgi:hypothetical protein